MMNIRNLRLHPANGWRAHLASNKTIGAAWIVFAASCLIALIASAFDVPVRALVRDAPAEFDFPVYGGIFTTISVATLAVAGGVFLVSLPDAKGPLRRLALTGASLTVFMALDDALQIHEEYGPRIGLTEQVFYFCYGIAALYCYRQARRLGDGALLSACHTAAGFLAFSAVIDIVGLEEPFKFWLEDFTKLAGFAAIVGVASVATRRALKEAGATGAL